MNISRNIPIFLIATILVFGTTISMGIPATFAQYYEDSYAKDKKTSNLNKQNVNCNNIIINGIDSAGQDTAGGDMTGNAMANGDEVDIPVNNSTVSQWLDNNGDKDSKAINQNIVNFCKNKNTEVVIVAEEEEEEEEEEGTGTLSITKGINCIAFTGPLSESACQDLLDGGPEHEITPDEFTIEVTGNNPNPSSFAGSEPPVDVTLGVGDYQVSEIADASVNEAIENIEDQFIPVQIDGPIVIFSGDCTQQDSTGVGSIAEGDTQTCNIENAFLAFERPAGEPGSPIPLNTDE